MNRFFPLILLLITLCSAEDFTLTDGTVLQEAKVVRQDGESAVISHSTGVQRVPFQRLPVELQQRLDLTPEAVQARRDQAAKAAKDRERALEKKAAQQREALAESALSPRYLTGAEVISLFSDWTPLSSAAAEYLAADWNSREALRCRLTVEAQRYRDEAARLSRRIESERSDVRRMEERSSVLEQQLLKSQAELQQAQARCQKLEAENQKLRTQPAQTTVVVSEPKLIPIYRPAPIILPPVRQPRPPMVRPPAPPPHRLPR